MKPHETNHFLNQLDVKLPGIARLHLAITTRETNISNALTAEDRMLPPSTMMTTCHGGCVAGRGSVMARYARVF